LTPDDFQQRALRLCRRHQAYRPGHVEVGAHPGVEARPGEIEAVLLGDDGLVEDGDLPVGASQLEVAARDVGRQRDQDIRLPFLGRFDLRQSGLLVSPHAAEDVELPDGIESRLEDVAGGRGLRQHDSARARDELL
jgi:hypothetical protein